MASTGAHASKGKAMKKKSDIKEAWASENRVFWTGRILRVDHDHLIPRMIIEIDDSMHVFGKSKGPAFRMGKSKWGRPILKCSPAILQLMEAAKRCDPHLIRTYLPRHNFSPYFEAFERHAWRVWNLREGCSSGYHLDVMNRWADGLRDELKASSFRRLVEKQQRCAHKNAASVTEFLHFRFHRRAKVLAIRLDLAYIQPDDPLEPWEQPTDAQVKAHLAAWLVRIKAMLPGDPKVMWKLEWGARKGHHLHIMILCLGDRVRQGITWARIAGEEWEKITGGAGSYWNCNSNERLFEAQGRRGIGLISHDDEVGRANLLRAALYMAKSEVYARFISPDIGRTFGRSIIKKEELHAKRRGRPRKSVESKPAGGAA